MLSILPSFYLLLFAIMKKIIFVLIMMTTLSTLTFSQTGLSSSFSVEGGLGTSHAPSFICLNYDIHLNDNFYWILSVGAPSLVTGIKYANYMSENSHTLVFGRDFYDEMLLRYSWVKEKEIGYSGNWSFNYGFQLVLVKWHYGQVHSDPGEPQVDDYMWYTESFLNTKGDWLMLKYLPYPLVNLKYQF
jgi:hypothetical protein